MSDFSVDTRFWRDPRDLRATAQTLLQRGEAPASLGCGLGPDALAALFRLASTSDSAEEALKLLHELQTHQIELDLQHEQITINEREAAAELARYKTLFECAPTGYVVLSREGRILESNRESANLLGVSGSELCGSFLAEHLTAESRPVLTGKLKQLFGDKACEAFVVDTLAGLDGRSVSEDQDESQAVKSHGLRVHATLAPDSDVILVNLSA